MITDKKKHIIDERKGVRAMISLVIRYQHQPISVFNDIFAGIKTI